MKQTIEIDVPDGYELDTTAMAAWVYPVKPKTPRKVVLVEQFTDTIEEGMYYMYKDEDDFSYCDVTRARDDYMSSIWAIEE